MAQAQIGLLLKVGQGVIQDESLSAEYFRKSAYQGYVEAQFNLAVYTISTLDFQRIDQYHLFDIFPSCDRLVSILQTTLGCSNPTDLDFINCEMLSMVKDQLSEEEMALLEQTIMRIR